MACVSGLTNGVYSFVDCCGNIQSGVSLGESICIDEAYSGSATGIYIATGVTCTQNCNTGLLSYTFTVTGICDTLSGSTTITPFGGVLPYTIDNIIPGTISAQTSNGPFTYTGLTGGTYVFRLNDSLGLQNNEAYINVFISECFVASIDDTTTTTCGLNNGTLTVNATSTNSPYNVILYKDGDVYQVTETQVLPYTFNNLSDGLYYATVFDYGSVSASTPNTLIYDSTEVSFGLWKVNTSNCVINTGKLAVTGLTGSGPFSYLWSNGETTQLITGLTQGQYSCTVTDSIGCTKTVSDTIGIALPLGLVGQTSVNPDCFASNGSITSVLSGGTAPYFYSANTGQVGYTLSDTFTLTNLGSGGYSFLVRDANFCVLNLTGYLNTQNGFRVLNLTTNNSTCDQNNGSLSVSIDGTGSQNYLYVLSAQTGGPVYTYYGTNQIFQQNGLSNGTYDLLISGSGAPCSYTTTATINSQQKFSISASTSGSTCGQPNGVATITVNSGYTSPITYILENIDTAFINDSVIPATTITAETFTSLVPGNYVISVVDSEGCSVSKSFSISTTNTINFAINPTNCVGSTLGYATTSIYQGEPPFTYLWSNGQTGNTATGLSAGTYSLLITDNNGCSDVNYFNITCVGEAISSYEIYNLCSNNFTTTTGAKRGVSEMFFEGFADITSGYTGCTISNAILTCSITINGSAYTQTFANITDIDDIPQDNVWLSAIDFILSNSNVVGNYTIDELNNTLSIESSCSGTTDSIGDSEYKLELNIEYDAVCLGTATTTPLIVCCEPTINNATPIGTGGLFDISMSLNCGPCSSTSIEYSTNSGTTWSTPISGICGTRRRIPTSATTATTSTVYFRMTKDCGSGVISDYSSNYIYSYPTPTPTPTPSPTPTPTPTPIPAFRFTVDTRIVYGPYTDHLSGYARTGSSGGSAIQLPIATTDSTAIYGTIDWGDGSTPIPLNRFNSFHTYATPGIYQISLFLNNDYSFEWAFDYILNPSLPNYPYGSDRLKFLSIDEWGGYKVGNSDNFGGCYNLKLDNVIDVPNLRDNVQPVLFKFAFSGQTTVKNIGNWDATNISDATEFFQQPYESTGRLTTESYNELLIGWANYGSALPDLIVLSVGDSTYSGGTATSAKNYLETTKVWTINDGGPV